MCCMVMVMVMVVVVVVVQQATTLCVLFQNK